MTTLPLQPGFTHTVIHLHPDGEWFIPLMYSFSRSFSLCSFVFIFSLLGLDLWQNKVIEIRQETQFIFNSFKNDSVWPSNILTFKIKINIHPVSVGWLVGLYLYLKAGYRKNYWPDPNGVWCRFQELTDSTVIKHDLRIKSKMETVCRRHRLGGSCYLRRGCCVFVCLFSCCFTITFITSFLSWFEKSGIFPGHFLKSAKVWIKEEYWALIGKVHDVLRALVVKLWIQRFWI